MKRLLPLLAVVCSATAVFGATPASNADARITGTVIDSVTNSPVEFATIALVNPGTGNPVDGTLADAKGEFVLQKVAPGTYHLTITFIGFETRVIPLTVENKNIDLGVIRISPVAQLLKEVTVEGQRAIIEEKVDRTIYNAENDETARGGDATDVLKRVPMLSVDLDGNVSLRGNQNILVLINNKPSTIMATSVADALKQIPAEEIKTVEVITSPSARYDAEGSGGIINIITKKNNLQGLTLNINSGVGLRGSNLGLNGNYRVGKFGVSLGGWGRANYNTPGSFESEQITGSITNLQRGDSRRNGMFGSYNLGFDYDINEKNYLAASVRFGMRGFNNYQDNLQQFTNGTLTRLQEIASEDQSRNIDASLTYTKTYDKPQRELSFQGMYSRNNRDNIYENLFFDVSDESVESRLKNLNDAYNEEMTLQADYQTPIGDRQMLEVGAKNITRSVFSDYTTFESVGLGEYVPSSNARFSNNLNYDQNVTAGYLSYTLSTGSGYSFKAGSRYEYTTIKAYTRTDDNIEIPSYGVLVPSINASKRLKDGDMIRASYNRRIQRPSIRFLNPNIQRSNNLNITVGNPQLDPEYTNNYEMGYSTLIKGTMLNVSGFFRNTNDGIQSVRDTTVLDGEQVIRTTYHNIGRENAAGMSIFANVTIGKLSINGGGDVYYATLDNKNPDPTLRAQNEGWVASGRLFGNYDLSKGWGLQFFSFVRGRQVHLQGTQGGFYMYSLAVRKEFNEKRGSIGIGAENFFTSPIRIRTEIQSPVLLQRTVNTMHNLSFRVNFSYRIGKMSLEDRPRRRRGINNDDLKMGGDGGDGMSMGNDGMGMNMNGGGQRGAGPGGARPNMASADPLPEASDSVLYNAEGTWKFTMETPQGPSEGTIQIQKQDNVYTGTIRTPRMPNDTPFTDVNVEGNTITITYNITFGPNTFPVEIKAVLTGENEMVGTMSFGQGRTVNINLTRQ